MSSPPAVTKILLPGKRGTLLQRPRLTNFLLEHIDRKLLLVSASAGYGKTSLLIDFAHETTLPVCWYSLDPSDSDPHTFLEYIVFSLQRRFPQFGKRTLALLANSSLVRDLDSVIGTLVTEIFEEIPDYFVLVLDDYQTVEDSESVNQVLDALLRHLPENAHLILSGRTMPSRITITRLVAHQEIAGLGANDLRFSSTEIRDLVEQTYHLTLTPTQAEELAQHSEGWITGILLTTHSLWQGLLQNLVRLEGSQVNVFNYLATEVFNQQSDRLKCFLLDSSVLSHMNRSLCNAVLGIADADEMLTLLEQRNLFVTRLEEDIAWYRYHHLFRDYLQSQLEKDDPQRWKRLHVRAADYLEAHGSTEQAIPHFVQAGAFKEAARAIQEIAMQVFDAGRWATLDGWIQAVPEDLLRESPNLIVWKARILGETGRHGEARDQFRRAIELFETNWSDAALAKTLVKQAVFLRFQGEYASAIHDCERALELLALDDLVEIAEAHRTIGIAASLAGDLTRGVQELELALRTCEQANDLANAARVHHDLGVSLRTAGRQGAETHFLQAMEFWRKAKNAGGLANTLNSIGVSFYRDGNYDKAIQTLEEALNSAREAGQMRIEAVVLTSLGDVYRDRGQFEHAEQSYTTAFRIAQQINESFLIAYVLVALGTVFRLEGELESADKVLRDAVEHARAHRSDYELGLAKTENGMLLYRRGRINPAIAELRHATELLTDVGAKADCARAHLHLARIFFDRKRLANADRELEMTAALGAAAGEQQFIVTEGAQILPVLRFAKSRRIGHGYFDQAAARIQAVMASQKRAKSTGPVIKPVLISANALGTAAVLIGDRPVSKADWDSVTAKELFFFLLSNPIGLRKDKILDTLWPEISPAKANGIFHSAMWRIRRALGRDCMIYKEGAYQVNPAKLTYYDVREFTQLVDRAEAARSGKSKSELYGRALELYRGDFYEDSYSDWSAAIRNTLLDQYLHAAETLGRLYRDQKQNEKAIQVFERLLTKDCYREDIYQLVIQLYMELGDSKGARRTFLRCKESVLEANLALSKETERLGGRASLMAGK